MVSHVLNVKELCAHNAASRCALLEQVYHRELRIATDEQAALMSFTMEGSYDGLIKMEAQLLQKHLGKPVRGKNPNNLSEVTNGPLNGLRIYNCDGHIIYVPKGFKIVSDPEIKTEGQKNLTIEKKIPDVAILPTPESDYSILTELTKKRKEKRQLMEKLFLETEENVNRIIKSEKIAQEKFDDIEQCLSKIRTDQELLIQLNQKKEMKKDQKKLAIEPDVKYYLTKPEFDERARNFNQQWNEVLAQYIQQKRTTESAVPVAKPSAPIDRRHVCYNEAVPPPQCIPPQQSSGIKTKPTQIHAHAPQVATTSNKAMNGNQEINKSMVHNSQLGKDNTTINETVMNMLNEPAKVEGKGPEALLNELIFALNGCYTAEEKQQFVANLKQQFHAKVLESRKNQELKKK